MNTIEKVTKVLSEMKIDTYAMGFGTPNTEVKFAQELSNIIKNYKKFSPLAFGDVKLPEVDDLIVRKLILDHRGHLLVYQDIDSDEYKKIFGVNINTFLNNRADYYFTFDQQCYMLNKIFKFKLFKNATEVKEFDNYSNYERRKLHDTFNHNKTDYHMRRAIEEYELKIVGVKNDHSEIKLSAEFDFQYYGLAGELCDENLMYVLNKEIGEYRDTAYFNENLIPGIDEYIKDATTNPDVERSRIRFEEQRDLDDAARYNYALEEIKRREEEEVISTTVTYKYYKKTF